VAGSRLLLRDKRRRFCINSVTGADEYNTVVNNNAYTNLMARENLRYAGDTVEALRKKNPMRITRSLTKQRSSLLRWRHGATPPSQILNAGPPFKILLSGAV
jgi:trehalose/maltose hydrolase-like predicted phosphorylase